jgi:hypothetical protein
MNNKWNGMRIDLSGSKAIITPPPIAQPRDIATMQMQRTYEVVRIRGRVGGEYFTPCLVLDGRPTSIQGRSHNYVRTARKALTKWAKQVEADLVNATIVDDGENASWEGVAMWDYHFEYVYKGNAHAHGYNHDRTLLTTRRCWFDPFARIIKEQPCDTPET